MNGAQLLKLPLQNLPTLAALLVAGFIPATEAAVFPNVINDGMETNHFQFFGNVPGLDPNYELAYAIVNTGGNPDSLLQVTDTFSTANTGETEQTFNVYTNFSWTPSIDGEIAALSFSIDVNLVDHGYKTIGFSVSDINGGSIDGFTSLLSIAPGSGWTTISVTNIPVGEYSGRDFAGTLPLRFGFSLISPNPVPMTETVYQIELDNFQVSVTTVPEPGVVGLLGVGAGLLALRSFRRR